MSIVKPNSNQASRLSTFVEEGFNVLGGIMKKVNVYAVPIVTLAILANIPRAEAGPITYAACIVTCEAISIALVAASGGVLTPALSASLYACTQACWPAFASPTP